MQELNVKAGPISNQGERIGSLHKYVIEGGEKSGGGRKKMRECTYAKKKGLQQSYQTCRQ
jgi:hypothetical protein